MLWKILATFGAFSFLYTGLSVLSDPSCESADIGGGRVIGVTCRQDSFGAFSAGTAGILIISIGMILLVFIYWNLIRRYFLSNSTKSSFSAAISKSDVRDEPSRMTSIKVCDYCGKELAPKWGHCPACLGTTFTHKQRELKTFEFEPQEIVDAEILPRVSKPTSVNPEFKDCPMCAEQIKFAAKKCRYCQHLMLEI